jgi:hypothetical protein
LASIAASRAFTISRLRDLDSARALDAIDSNIDVGILAWKQMVVWAGSAMVGSGKVSCYTSKAMTAYDMVQKNRENRENIFGEIIARGSYNGEV